VNDLLVLAIYSTPLVLIYWVVLRRRLRLERASETLLLDSREAGLMQPPSLHPVVDANKCIGCESCVHACPEFPAHQVLGIVGGKAHLVSPSDCIGHGACQQACPVGAISLVFGTRERGIDLPSVNPDFSTNVPGIYIAGELGGMGLIRNAIEQGRQAVGSIVNGLKHETRDEGDTLDLFIVGAGPAGIAASLGAMEAGITYTTIEQHEFGGTVARFPRGKLVMTAPADLPLVGRVQFKDVRKEELIGFWDSIREETGLQVQCNERLESLCRSATGVWESVTNRGAYRSRNVLLAIGRRGTPRGLDVPGELLPKVTYSLVDPGQYAGKSVLVVGGGDSALEATCALAEEPGTDATLSYRGPAFHRAKRANRTRLQAAEQAGKVRVLMNSQVVEIGENTVAIEHEGTISTLPNHVVIICAGGVMPTGLLADVGISMETKYGTA